MPKTKREIASFDTIMLAKSLDVVKDKKGLKSTVRTLKQAAAGEKVSDARLKRAQEFCLRLLEELNSKRPQGPQGCSGGRKLPAFLL